MKTKKVKLILPFYDTHVKTTRPAFFILSGAKILQANEKSCRIIADENNSKKGEFILAYVFKNQPTATAVIQPTGSNTSMKLAGINGEQTDAGNFRTAIADFIGIGGIAISQEENSLQRSVNQSVETDEEGADPQFTLDPMTFSVENFGESGFSSTISVGNYKLNFSNLTYSGKKPVGTTFAIDTGEYELRMYGRAQGYTTGTSSAILTVTLPAQDVDGTHYRSSSVDITFTGGVAGEFEEIS